MLIPESIIIPIISPNSKGVFTISFITSGKTAETGIIEIIFNDLTKSSVKKTINI